MEYRERKDMRRAQQEEILDFIKSLHQAHKEMKDALHKGKTVVVQNMLAECQEFAQTLGGAIERAEGEGHVTVRYVEAYCEVLFHIYGEVGNGQINESRIEKKLKKALLEIENSVKNDIKVKKEIAFFPYKASMWDSLESIYLAEKKNPDCDVYCVPIPYFDLNPDHSFGQMHYEGGQYPKNIEVTDWKTYHFEERRPDEVYIHNAYDNSNLITSVHPRFYSANLKKYTEKLIYVPYFVMGDIDPYDQTIIDAKKNFCFMPGIIHADNVILESESVRKLYINEYRKAAKEVGLPEEHVNRKCLEKKFLGLGSPKFDKIFTLKKEELQIPAKWRRTICKFDGSRKKVIFYNTGITALLHNNEEWLEKIKGSLKVFKENRDEVALLWRPHPLIEETMKSMRPELLDKYLEIKEGYLREDWGIYDDTVDIDRAVALSDAYYGDNSSVVQLFIQVNKPVLVAAYDNE